MDLNLYEVISSPVYIISVGFLIYVIASMRVNRARELNDVEKFFESLEKADELSQVQHIITHRSDQIIGYYQNVPIHDWVVLADGRKFNYLSIAIQVAPGLYLSDFEDEEHIVVDGCLLYKPESNEDPNGKETTLPKN